jgi:pimeloyl-ACP methyl ester carboxylesterase
VITTASAIQIRGAAASYQWVTSSSDRLTRTDRPVLVFLHGWGGSSRYWRSTAEAFADTYDCLLYDWRGFGKSAIAVDSHPSDYGLKAYAEDLADLLNQLGVNKISVIAHSLGTSIAPYFMRLWTGEVEKAVMTCGGVFKFDALAYSWFYRVGQAIVNVRPQWFYDLPGMDWFVMTRFVHRMISPIDRAEFIDDYLSCQPPAALGVLLDVSQAKTCEELVDNIKAIDIPVLMLSGQKDQIIPPLLGKNAAKLNDRIIHQVLKKVGHLPMLEDPEAYQTAVRSFFEPLGICN